MNQSWCITNSVYSLNKDESLIWLSAVSAGEEGTICLLCWREEKRTGERREKRGLEEEENLFSAAVRLLYDGGKKSKRKKRKKRTAERRTGSIRELRLFLLLKFIDRNTCATLSHNTAYDQFGPKPSPLSLRHVYLKTRHFSACSQPSVFPPYSVSALLPSCFSPSLSYITPGSSLTWFRDKVVNSLMYIRGKTLSVLMSCSWCFSSIFRFSFQHTHIYTG